MGGCAGIKRLTRTDGKQEVLEGKSKGNDEAKSDCGSTRYTICGRCDFEFHGEQLSGQVLLVIQYYTRQDIF